MEMGGHGLVTNQKLDSNKSETWIKNSYADSDKDEIKTLDSETDSDAGKVTSADTEPDTGLSDNFDLGIRQTSTCILNVLNEYIE